MSKIYEGLVSAGRDLLGGVQGGVSSGSGGTSWSLSFGEKRVMSWAALGAAILVGFVLGRAS